jgi:methionyl-tRNA synthetase
MFEVNADISEYLQYKGDKFSKSRGVGVFGDQAKFTGQSSSVFRYYLLSSRPETSDSQFLWREFITKHNTELNNLGNLVNRVTKFLTSKYHSIVPDYTKDTSDTAGTKKLEEIINEKLKEYVKQMDRLKLKEGLKLAMDISMQLNSFLQENKLDNSLFSNFPRVKPISTLHAMPLRLNESETKMPYTSNTISISPKSTFSFLF